MNPYQRLRSALPRHSRGFLYRCALCFANWLLSVCCVGGSRYPLPPLHLGGGYFQRSERQGTRLYVRSCLRPLHTLHMDCRFSMLWFGSPKPGAMMWSIVQSPPSRSLPHIVQIGSRTFLAASLANRQAFDWCQSATVCLVEQYVGSYPVNASHDVLQVFGWLDVVGV